MNYLPGILLAIFIVLIGIIGWRTLLAPTLEVEKTSLANAMNAELALTEFMESLLALSATEENTTKVSEKLSQKAQTEILPPTFIDDLLTFMGLQSLPASDVSIADIYFTADNSALIMISFRSGTEIIRRSVEMVSEEGKWKINAVYPVDDLG